MDGLYFTDSEINSCYFTGDSILTILQNMKSVFKKLILLFFLIFNSTHLLARDIILIENQGKNDVGNMLKKILIKKFNIPNELITLKSITRECEYKTDSIVHFCLDSDGELHVKKIDHFIVKNSLGIFLNQSNDGEE